MSEHDVQASFVRWCADMARLGIYPELAWSHAVPNGGYRRGSEAVRLSAEGVKAGVLDWVLHADGKTADGRPTKRLWIEFKFGKNKLTEAQLVWLNYFQNLGDRVELCRSDLDAIRVVIDYLGPRRGTEAWLSEK